jgi:paired amphipathic helix protein Sin3a
LGAEAYEGGDGQERAQKNLVRFVDEHMVPASPWAEGEKVKPIGGEREVWWVTKNGVKMVSLDFVTLFP